MTLVRSKPSGFGVHDKLTSVEQELIDSQLPYALDGNAGGTYAPSSVITIAGSGADFTTTLTVSGTLEVTGTTNLDGPTTSTVSITIDGGSSALLELTSGATLQGDAGSILAWAGTSTFTGTVAMNGIATFNATPVFASGLTVSSGTANLNTTTQIGGFFNCSAVMVLQGGARVRERRVSGMNADTSYAVADATVVDVPTLSANRTYAISSTGAVDGDTITFTMASDATSANGFGITLQRVSDATSIGPGIVKTVGAPVWMRIIFDSTKWQPCEWGLYDAT